MIADLGSSEDWNYQLSSKDDLDKAADDAGKVSEVATFELAAQGIRVNAICPGVVGTAMWLEHILPSNTTDEGEKNQNFEDTMTTQVPLGRPQTVEDMGQAAVYLASAINVTGVALTVAGGMEMN